MFLDSKTPHPPKKRLLEGKCCCTKKTNSVSSHYPQMMALADTIRTYFFSKYHDITIYATY
jgi:hypothetical protein